MKVLIITGKLASNLVKRESAKSKHDIHVHVVKTPIAAFLTPKKIVEEIKKYGGYDIKTDTSDDLQIDDLHDKFNINSFDIILTPGLIRKDVSYVKEKTGIDTYKGPKDAADLAIVIEMIDKLELSPRIPADKLIEDELRERALKFINDFESNEKNES